MTYMKNSQKINNKLLDIDLVSIEDYTVRGSISREFYEAAVQNTLKRMESSDLSSDQETWPKAQNK